MKRLPEIRLEVLSGDVLGDDDSGGDTLENCYHVVTTHGVDDTCVLDGVTIQAGRADGPNFGPSVDSRDQGSGVNNYFGTPRLINCTIRDNYSLNHGAFNDHGNATFIGCTFRDNFSANIAGGLYMHFDSSTSVTGCIFANNIADGDGGGAYHKGNNTSTFSECIFNQNEARGTAGGGIYVGAQSQPIITGCAFAGNIADQHGAGIYNHVDTSTLISGCNFAKGQASFGAGVYAAADSTVTVENCSFSANSGSRGAGLYNGFNSRSIIASCVFTSNSASFGGGAYNDEGSQALFTDCEFTDNHIVPLTSSSSGGAMYNARDAAPLIRGCTFAGNVAKNGGAVYNQVDTSPVFVNSSFVGNAATDLYAGAISAVIAVGTPGTIHLTCIGCTFVGNTSAVFGGALAATRRADMTLANCVFSGNSAVSYGGGISFGDDFGGEARLHITNCTLAGNTAGLLAGGLRVNNATMDASNCIFWGNSDTSGDVERAQAGWNTPPVGTFNINCIQGLSGALGGTGNIGTDPLFTNPAGDDAIVGTLDDDLRVPVSSPSINAGSTTALPPDTYDLDGNSNRLEPIPLDIMGLPRVSGVAVDMGAHEVPMGPNPIPAVGAWGFAGLASLIIAIGSVLIRRRADRVDERMP